MHVSRDRVNVYNVITRHAGRRAVAQGLKRVHVSLALMCKGVHIVQKASRCTGKGGKVCKKPAGHCCARRISKQVSASSDKVSFKRPAAALASGSQLVLKRPASGGGSKTRVQLQGERVHCSLEKYDDLAQALQALRST